MKLAQGNCYVNGLHLVEIHVERDLTNDLRGYSNSTPLIKVVYSLATIKEVKNDTEKPVYELTGTHGKCTEQSNWSPTTLEALKILTNSIENDLTNKHFYNVKGDEDNDTNLININEHRERSYQI